MLQSLKVTTKERQRFSPFPDRPTDGETMGQEIVRLTVHLPFVGKNDFASTTWRIYGKSFLKALLDIRRPHTLRVRCRQVLLVLEKYDHDSRLSSGGGESEAEVNGLELLLIVHETARLSLKRPIINPLASFRAFGGWTAASSQSYRTIAIDNFASEIIRDLLALREET